MSFTDGYLRLLADFAAGVAVDETVLRRAVDWLLGEHEAHAALVDEILEKGLTAGDGSAFEAVNL